MKKPEDYGFTIIDSLPLPEAQDLKLLPPLLGMQIDTKEVVDVIPLTLSGNINFKALEKVLKASPELRPYIADKIASIISSEGNQYKTVIAVNFVWEAQELASLLREKGITVGVAVNKASAKQIHSEEIPAIDSVERYKLPKEDEKSIQVLISPYVASEGFDAPFTEVLVWASPTDSSLRYTQYTGRLARRNPGKRFGVVVDCLYQTNQYSWSYNMGMWMKGDVKQLENGFLWLGPDMDIDLIKRLPIIQTLNNQNNPKDLNELQKEGLLDVQDTDFVLSTPQIAKFFRYSDVERIKKIAQELKEANNSMFSIRTSRSQKVEVCVDKDEFVKILIQQGFSFRYPFIDALNKIQENEFPLNLNSEKLFVHLNTGGLLKREDYWKAMGEIKLQ